MGERRTLLGTGAVLVGLGSALISGTAVAAAGTGDADTKSADSSARDPAAGESSTPGIESRLPGTGARNAAAHEAGSDAPLAHTRISGRTAGSGDRLDRIPENVAEISDNLAKVTENEAPAAEPETAAVVEPTFPSVSVNPAVAPARRGSAAQRQSTPPAAVVGTAPAAEAETAAPVIAEVEEPAVVVPTVAVAELAVPAAVNNVVPTVPAAEVAYAAPAPTPAATLLSTALTGFGWQPGEDLAIESPARAIFTGQRRSAAPAAAVRTAPVAGAPPDPNLVGEAASALLPPLPTDGVTGVQVGHSRLAIPGAFIGNSVATDWYFPTQTDGAIDAQGVIWLQHGFGATNTFYSALAQDLAQSTNSIVVAPTLSSLPFTFSGGCLNCDVTQQAAPRRSSTPTAPPWSTAPSTRGTPATSTSSRADSSCRGIRPAAGSPPRWLPTTSVREAPSRTPT